MILEVSGFAQIPRGNQFRSEEVRQAKSYPRVKSYVFFYREIISPLALQNHIQSSGNHIHLYCSVLAKSYPIGKLYPHSVLT